MNEMRVILAKLLRQFSFSVDADKREFRRSIQVAIRATPDVVVRVRKLKCSTESTESIESSELTESTE